MFVDFKFNPIENSVFQFSVSDLHSVKPGINEVYCTTQTFSLTTRI